jgi:hydrogenase maturation protease
MKSIILGMGNTLLSDDGIGILVARYLRKQFSGSENVEIEETSWGGFRIIDFLREYDYAIIIDSITTLRKPAGFIHKFKPGDFLPTLRLNSYHDINFITALELGKQFKAHMPTDIDILAIEVRDTKTISEQISEEILPSFSECTEMVVSKLVSKKIIDNKTADSVLSAEFRKEDLFSLYYYYLPAEDYLLAPVFSNPQQKITT